MKQRILSVLLCMMILISVTTISVLSAPGDMDKPLTVTFENPAWTGQTVTLDVKLSNSLTADVRVSLIDLNLTVTGSYAGFTASDGSGMLEDVSGSSLRLYRTELGTTLTVPAKVGETSGALALGTIKIAADTNGKTELKQVTTPTDDGVMSPGYQNSLLGSVAEFSATAPAAGVAVSGLVQGYNSSHAPVAKLYAIADTTHSNPLYTAAVSSATAADEQYTWTVSFANVAPGKYDMVVTKAAHLTYTITGVTVGDTALDLTDETTKPYSTMRMLCGDLNSDGSINVDDLNIVWKPTNYLKALGDVGVDGSADINGDKTINIDDLNIVWNPGNYLKSGEDSTVWY